MSILLYFLADANVEKGIVDTIRELGYDIKWISITNPTLEDENIIELARQENRIIISNDKDFGEFIFRQGVVTSGVILFRTKGMPANEKSSLIIKLLSTHTFKLYGHFIIIRKTRFRFIKIQKIVGDVNE